MDESAAGATERRDEAYELDERLTVVGPRLAAGDRAPGFRLACFDASDERMLEVGLEDSDGEVRLLNVVNSLDTPVCHVETRRWEGLRGDLPAGTTVYTISMDLPFAQARWQTTEGVTHESLSAHKNESFGRDYGVLLKEWRLLQRAVFVIDRNDRITYADYVPDQMREPDYNKAVEAVRQTAST